MQRDVIRREPGEKEESEKQSGYKDGRYQGFMIGLGNSINETGKFFERTFYQITQNKKGLEELNLKEKKFIQKYSEMKANTLKDKSPAYLEAFSRYKLGRQIAGFILELVILKRLAGFKAMHIFSSSFIGSRLLRVRFIGAGSIHKKIMLAEWRFYDSEYRKYLKNPSIFPIWVNKGIKRIKKTFE